jgi:hypothetical protein
MYFVQNSNYYSKKFRPIIYQMLDINRQKYKKNRVIIKRNLSYSNPGGPPQDPMPYILMLLVPIVISMNNYFRKFK